MKRRQSAKIVRMVWKCRGLDWRRRTFDEAAWTFFRRCKKTSPRYSWFLVHEAWERLERTTGEAK